MKRALLLGVVALLLLPFVLSFDCSSVSNVEACKSVVKSDISISEKDALFSFLLYPENSIPNHDLVKQYNNKVSVTNQNPKYSSKYIKNAWIKLSAFSPSVTEEQVLYVPTVTQALSHFKHEVQLPENYNAGKYPRHSNNDCRRTHLLHSSSFNVQYYVNGVPQKNPLLISSNSVVEVAYSISVTVKTEHYKWKKVWYSKKPKCRYSHSTYDTDSLTVKDSKQVSLYLLKPSISVKTVDIYSDTLKGEYKAQDYSYLLLNFPESSLEEKKYSYTVEFDKDYIATLKATKINSLSQDNLIVSGDQFYTKETKECSYKASNHFYSKEGDCNLKNKTEEHTLEKKEKDIDFSILIHLLLLGGLVYILYKIGKSKLKLFFLLALILIPVALAGGGEKTECSITNFGTCIEGVLTDFILTLINTPIKPVLELNKSLLTIDVNISMFESLWSIIRYMLGLFYIFLIIYAGFMFMTSSGNPFKRHKAKEALKNAIIMMLLIQASYYLYDLVLNISSNLSLGLLQFVDPKFFLITADSFANAFLQIFFTMPYTMILYFTLILLVIRYIVVALGVVLFPVAIFCYYIPPLKSYGQFLLQLLGIFIFVTFFDMLIILGCAQILTIPFFAAIKTVVMTVCFTLISLSLVSAFYFAYKKSGAKQLGGKLVKAGKWIAAL